jgi:hypothetical protein
MDAVIDALEIDGWKLLRDALDPDQCDALLQAANGADRIVMPHRTIPQFLLGMRVCARFARHALGDDISGLGSDYFAASAGFATHTDNDYVQALPGTFVSVWVPLAHVTERNGPLVIGGNIITCRKSDVLLIDGDTPHRSCAGQGPRPVSLFTFIKRGFPFRPGRTQQRTEVNV